MWVGGSFVSLQDYGHEPRPRDVDVAYEAERGNDPLDWDQRKRDRLKARRKVDLVPSYYKTSVLDPTPILDRFRRDDHDRPRGLVVLEKDEQENADD